MSFGKCRPCGGDSFTFSGAVSGSNFGAQDQRLDATEQRIKQMHWDIIDLKAENAKLHSKVDRLESYSRQNNVIVYGLEESPDESCEAKVKEMLCSQLCVLTTLTSTSVTAWGNPAALSQDLIYESDEINVQESQVMC